MFTLVTVLIICSCGLFKGKSDQCILIPEENKIIGTDKSAKSFISQNDNYYVPWIIENLLFDNTMFATNYNEPLPQYAEVDTVSGQIRMVNNPKAKSKLRGSYRIEGCVDTTWAKKRMAEHLLNKYRLTRKDSFQIRDTYKFEFIADSIHLLSSHTDLNVIRGMGDFRGNLSCRGCLIEEFVSQTVGRTENYWRKNNNREYTIMPSISSENIEQLTKDKFVFEYQYNQKKGIKFDELVPNLQRKYGIILSHEKIDTLKMGFYLYEDN